MKSIPEPKFYHKYLDLPFEIAKPTIDYTVKSHWDNVDLNFRYRDNNIESWFKQLGLTVGKYEVFYTPPHGSVPIHADDYNTKKELPDDHVKVNITFGPEEATTRWWKSDKTFFIKDATMECLSRLTLCAKEEDSTMVYEANTNSPSLINAGVLHSTYNPTDEGRWTMCFVPCMGGRVIPAARALVIFKHYIKE